MTDFMIDRQNQETRILNAEDFDLNEACRKVFFVCNQPFKLTFKKK